MGAALLCVDRQTDEGKDMKCVTVTFTICFRKFLIGDYSLLFACGLWKFIRCAACVVSIWAPLRFSSQLRNYRNIDVGSYDFAIQCQAHLFIYL